MTRESQLVDHVLGQMRGKRPDSEIRSELEASGLPPGVATDVIDCIRAGFKAGTLAVVTGGASAINRTSDDNPLYAIAYKRGKAAMRFTTPGWVLLRMIWPYLLGAVVVVGVILLWIMKCCQPR